MLTRVTTFLAVTVLVFAGSAAAEDKDPAKKDDAAKAPVEGDARAEWIQDLLGIVRDGAATKRRAALASLIENDKDGDTTTPLIALVAAGTLDEDALVDVIRVLGIDSLVAAVEPLVALLTHANALVRGNAVVSLEYIGSYAAVDALKRQVGKEKLGSIKGHLYRALGRCGAGQSAVRGLLLKALKKAEADQDLVGPLVGLAYFERDPRVARRVEKTLAKAVVPKGTNALADRQRARLMGWLLAEVADPKTPKFIRDKVLPRLRNNTSLSVVSVAGNEQQFYEAVARKIEGDPSAGSTVDRALGAVDTADAVGGDITTLRRVVGAGISTMDEMRKGRDMSSFQPKGDRKTLSLADVARRAKD